MILVRWSYRNSAINLRQDMDITYGFPLFIRDGIIENLSPGFRSYIDAQYTITVVQIYLVIFMPFYMRRLIEIATTSFCASTSRVCLLRWTRRISKSSRASAGRWGRSASPPQLSRAATWPPITAKAITRSSASATRRPSSPSRSTRRKSSRLCRFVWNFHIGGYQVLDKYLKSRKGRKLSLDEIDHVAKVADALVFTIDQMSKIDNAYRAAFP